MGWNSIFRAPGRAEATDPSDETVINSAPYDPKKTIRGGSQRPAAPGDRPEAQIEEEIKRRQLLLSLRYVEAVRARKAASFWRHESWHDGSDPAVRHINSQL